MAPKLPVYLDYHATTPVDPRVFEAMRPYFTEHFGNAASRSHVFGMRAASAVEKAREEVADLVGANAKEIVFTSGATEADNLAVLGAARARRAMGAHVVVSSIEHRAVLDPCARLEAEGFRVTRVAPDRLGRTGAAAVAWALSAETVLVTVMAANNEIGTLNPVAEIAGLCKERGILFHTDAVQAAGKVPLDVHAAGIDLLSLSAHKLCGPKGVGALFVRASNPRVTLDPILFGGGHERGMRPGTLDVPGIVGFGAAAAIAKAEGPAEAVRVSALRDRLWERLRAAVPGASRNGDPAASLPGNLNVRFPGAPSDTVMMETRDLAVSAGSACTSASVEPSHVLRGIGLTKEEAHESIRFGLGRFTSEEDVDWAADAVASAVRRVRAARGTTGPLV
ncbi:MAG TPA: aminotransferase class V-fold PLP-dependent enzyme [Thermoanaerobaculia bacterium]|nr:aminotransferase class V-fold PLP-dependent enzyme [Thermoanaerobaculia bacterium]